MPPSTRSKKIKKGPPMVNKGHKLYNRKMEMVPLLRGLQVGPTETITVGSSLLLTPINLINPATEFAVLAKIDYTAEAHKFNKGEQYPIWDNCRGNKGQVGDYFLFCHNQTSQGRDLAEVFMITAKLPVTRRPEHWRIKEHQDRDVLVLSRYLGYTTVTDVMVAVGSRPSAEKGCNCLRGTIRKMVTKELLITAEKPTR